MRYGYLSPHQFASLSQFIDTWLLTGYTLTPLDIATPHAASQLIVSRIRDLVKERFMGRMAELDLGPTPGLLGLDQPLANLVLPGEQAAVFVLVADRFLRTERIHWKDADGRPWIAFDWWQWFVRRVPAERRYDVWLYLCLANPSYPSSPEFRATGLPPEQASEMANEGERLLRLFVDDIASDVVALWGAEQNQGESESDGTEA